MILKTLSLFNFRNHRKKTFSFSDKVNVIVGNNASGKTNVLESVFLLSTGKSLKANREEEMIMIVEELSKIKGTVSFRSYSNNLSNDDLDSVENLEVILTRGFLELGTSVPRKAPKKRLLVNGNPKRLVDFAGRLKVVLFGPWDMNLVTDPPSARRSFLDLVISQTDREYRRCVVAYEKALRQRNKLLFRIREEGVSRNQLIFWNQLLIRNGEYIARKRAEFIEFTNSASQLTDCMYQLYYDKSVISESRLEQYKKEEVASATTLVGPHRDDFRFLILNSKISDDAFDLAFYGSRGEQRMGVLWLKLAELAFIEKVCKERPVLLLDDILSELDHEHRHIVLSTMKNQQTIMTTADYHYVEDLKGVEIANIINLN
ncbi:MAG: AAA family ATPase [Patescibacteria group bacterium]|nr:AAA family ATPase [Patescibacteria group bacterium]